MSADEGAPLPTVLSASQARAAVTSSGVRGARPTFFKFWTSAAPAMTTVARPSAPPPKSEAPKPTPKEALKPTPKHPAPVEDAKPAITPPKDEPVAAPRKKERTKPTKARAAQRETEPAPPALGPRIWGLNPLLAGHR